MHNKYISCDHTAKNNFLVLIKKNLKQEKFSREPRKKIIFVI